MSRELRAKLAVKRGGVVLTLTIRKQKSLFPLICFVLIAESLQQQNELHIK